MIAPVPAIQITHTSPAGGRLLGKLWHQEVEWPEAKEHLKIEDHRQVKHHIPYIIYVIREYLPIWMVDFYGEVESKYTIYIYMDPMGIFHW